MLAIHGFHLENTFLKKSYIKDPFVIPLSECYCEENISKKIEISCVITVLLSIAPNKLPCKRRFK